MFTLYVLHYTIVSVTKWQKKVQFLIAPFKKYINYQNSFFFPYKMIIIHISF